MEERTEEEPKWNSRELFMYEKRPTPEKSRDKT